MSDKFEALKAAALGANLHGWTGIEDSLNADGYSRAMTRFIQHCRPSEILELLAALEKAKKNQRTDWDRCLDAEHTKMQALLSQAERRAEAAEQLLAAQKVTSTNRRYIDGIDPYMSNAACLREINEALGDGMGITMFSQVATGISDMRSELEQRLKQPIKLPDGFRIVPIKPTREQLAVVQVAGKSVVYTDMVLAAPEHPGFKVEGE